MVSTDSEPIETARFFPVPIDPLVMLAVANTASNPREELTAVESGSSAAANALVLLSSNRVSLDYSWADPPGAPRIQNLNLPGDANAASVPENRHPDATHAADESVPAPDPALENRPLDIVDGEHVSATCFFESDGEVFY